MPRTPNALTAQQKAKIAYGKAAGHTQKQIAAEANCSQSTVAHATVRHPEIRTMMAELGYRARAEMHEVFAEFLLGLREDHKTAKTLNQRQSLRAEYFRIVSLVDGTAPQEKLTSDGDYTLTELLAVVRTVHLEKSQGGPTS